MFRDLIHIHSYHSRHKLLPHALHKLEVLRVEFVWHCGRTNSRVVVLLLSLSDFAAMEVPDIDRKSTRLNSSHGYISYAVFCLKKKKKNNNDIYIICILQMSCACRFSVDTVWSSQEHSC